MMLRKIEGINIVPFIDIMLVLLVIVLMEATFVRADLITLPKSELGVSVGKQDAITLSITKEGRILFEGEEMSLANIENKLKTIDKNRAIHIRGDAKSALEEFVGLLGVLQNLNMSNLSILTESKQ